MNHATEVLIDPEEERDNEKDTINTPFDPKQVDIIPRKFSINTMLERLIHKELDLSPDFQRRANLWNDQRKSRLIESILLRIPLPSFYFKEDTDGNFSVVDGLQRLCAIFHFINYKEINKATKANPPLNSLRLIDLQYLKEIEGKEFSELDRAFQRRINELEIEANIIRSGTPKAVMFNVFARLNQGGLPLSAQEIRNAIYTGIWRDRIRNIANSIAFKTATKNKIPTERQQDMEMILRFFALYALDTKGQRPENEILDKFLNDTVEKRLPTWKDIDWNYAEQQFFRSLDAAIIIFGEHAFRKSYGNEAKTPINKGLFESQMLALSLLSDKEINLLIEKKNLIQDSFGKEIQNQSSKLNKALRSGTGHADSSNIRTAEFQKIFNEVIHAQLY